MRRRRECLECKNKFTTYEVDYNWYLCIKKMAEAIKECAAIGDQLE
jgi:transcriptional regulator NrdR family protein